MFCRQKEACLWTGPCFSGGWLLAFPRLRRLYGEKFVKGFLVQRQGKRKKLPLGFSLPLFLPLWPFYCSCLTAAIKRNIERRVSSCHSGCLSSSSCVGCGS